MEIKISFPLNVFICSRQSYWCTQGVKKTESKESKTRGKDRFRGRKIL